MCLCSSFNTPHLLPPLCPQHTGDKAVGTFFFLFFWRVEEYATPRYDCRGLGHDTPKYAALAHWQFWETANVGRGFLSTPLICIKQTLQNELYHLSPLPTFPGSLISQERLVLIAGGKTRSWHHCVLSHFSHVQHFPSLETIAHQAPLSMGFSRQEYWSALPCPPLGDLPNPGIEPTSLTSPALAGRSFTTCATWHHVQTDCVTNSHSSYLFFYRPICLS